MPLITEDAGLQWAKIQCTVCTRTKRYESVRKLGHLQSERGEKEKVAHEEIINKIIDNSMVYFITPRSNSRFLDDIAIAHTHTLIHKSGCLLSRVKGGHNLRPRISLSEAKTK